MYENTTFEVILQRMLDRVPDQLDKRESSPIYNALAPAAVELQLMYIELDTILNESFADTQTRTYLIKRASERGVIPKAATYAVLKSEFTPTSIEIPIGARFSLNDLNYYIKAKIEDGIYQVECEEPGVKGNQYFGDLIPIEYIDGLETAKLTELLIPGEDEEDTESLRRRYFNSLDSQSFGGNISDYKEKLNAINGVGGVKVYPTPDGIGGTVKLVIIDSNYNVPSSTLINEVQSKVDPIQNQGQGVGIAPIGHVVNVEGVTSTNINISTNITYQEGWQWIDIEPNVHKAIDDYFHELAESWSGESNLIVRISQIEIRLLNVAGVIDIADTSINELEQNFSLDADSIPIRGDVLG